MAKILIVSRHRFRKKQIEGLRAIHGKKVLIQQENVRFVQKIEINPEVVEECDDCDMLIEFHNEKLKKNREDTEGYDYIYYILSPFLGDILIANNLPFGIIERPKEENRSTILRIVHRVSKNETVEKYLQVIRHGRKGNKGFYRPQKQSVYRG